MIKSNYIGKYSAYCMLIARTCRPVFVKSLFLLLFIYAFTTSAVKPRINSIMQKKFLPYPYDEIPVNVAIEGVGSFNVDIIYTNTDLVYINIEDLFRTLRIPCIVGQKGDSLGGFIENEKRTYSIDFNQGQIKVGNRLFNTMDKLIKETGALYMESSFFTEVFGIQLSFNYRSLSMKLKSDFELPIIKQMRIEKMWSNIAKVRGEIIADTIVKRNYHLFKPGAMDWSIASFQKWKGSTDNRFGLGLGAELLYGEAVIAVNYYDKYKFDDRQLHYHWRWVDNEKTLIRQAQLGKIPVQTISFVNSPVVGAVVRNTPTTVRKASGYYTISEITEPDWTVELYINNVLVDYTTADASGAFSFKVPVVYGFTTLKLKYYGPMGEERTEERVKNVPYTFMPVNEFEYGVSAG